MLETVEEDVVAMKKPSVKKDSGGRTHGRTLMRSVALRGRRIVVAGHTDGH